jgi:hypothetical protein
MFQYIQIVFFLYTHIFDMYIFIFMFFNIYIYMYIYMYVYLYIYVRVCHEYLISPPNGRLSTQIDAQQTLNHHRPGGGWWSDIRNAPRFLNDSEEPSGNDVYLDDVHLVVHPKEVTITKIFFEHKGIPWLGMMYMTPFKRWLLGWENHRKTRVK